MLEVFNRKSDANINLFLLKKTFEYVGTYVEPKLSTLFKTLYGRLSGLFEGFFNHIRKLEEVRARAGKARATEDQLRRKIAELEGKLKASKNSRLISSIDPQTRSPRRVRCRSRIWPKKSRLRPSSGRIATKTDSNRPSGATRRPRRARRG